MSAFVTAAVRNELGRRLLHAFVAGLVDGAWPLRLGGGRPVQRDVRGDRSRNRRERGGCLLMTPGGTAGRRSLGAATPLPKTDVAVLMLHGFAAANLLPSGNELGGVGALSPARDPPLAIAGDAGRSRPARPVPSWRTRGRPGPFPGADSARRSPATSRRSPERCGPRSPTDTYRTVGMVRSTIRVNRPAASMRRTFRESATLIPCLPAGCVLVPDRQGQRATVLARRHRQRRDMRFGQEQLAVAHRQAAIRHKPEPKHRH